MFSRSAEYALRATIYIAQKSSPEKKLGLLEISEAIDSPPSFTAKVLQMLTKNNRIISSSTGPGGGFFIAEKSKKLPLRTILIAVNEDDALTKCILGLNECSSAKPCPMHSQYQQIKLQLIQLFESRTIGDLAGKMLEERHFLGNKK